MILVELIKIKFVHGTPSKLTVALDKKSTPVSVKAVPPAMSPVLTERDVIEGAAI